MSLIGNDSAGLVHRHHHGRHRRLLDRPRRRRSSAPTGSPRPRPRPPGTGVARVDVVGDLVGGTTILDVTDPSGDDHGPGTFQYPTSSAFHDGAFDITRFQVLQQGDTVYLRTTLRDLSDTFGLPGRRPAPRRLRPPAGRRVVQHGPTVREPQLLPGRRLGLEPAAGGAGLRRTGLEGRRRWHRGHPHSGGRVPGDPDDHDRPAGRRSSARPAPAGPSRSPCTVRTGSPPTRPAASSRRRRTSSSACAPPVGRRRSARSPRAPRPR